MAHHSREDDIRDLLGATGQFPLGKLTPSDEGELKLAIGRKDGKVVLVFGKPVAWIGFTAEQAREIAQMLVEHATAADGGQ